MKMNKILAAVAAIGLAVTSLPLSAVSAASTKVSYSYNKTTRTLTISGNGTITASGVYRYADTLDVIINDGITSIDANAFDTLTYLCSVKNYSDDLKTIKKSTFEGHSTLYSFETVPGIQRIEEDAFSYCNVLNNVILPDTISYIDKYAFYHDSNVELRAEADSYAYNELAKQGYRKGTNLLVLGDANNNGMIDMGDSVMLSQALSNPNKWGVNGSDPTHITKKGWRNADIYGLDGVTANDILAIQLYCNGGYACVKSLPTMKLS